MRDQGKDRIFSNEEGAIRRIGLDYVRGVVLLACVFVPSAPGSAQSAVDPVDEALVDLAASALPTAPIAFVAIPPCRLADTRGNGFSGPFGPPSMVGNAARVFPVAGNCGIPVTAQAVSANMAVTNTIGAGFISVWPEGAAQPAPLVASMNYSAGQTIANAVLAPLGTNGGITVYAKVGLDLIIDVNGYFDTGAAGPTGPTGPTGATGSAGAIGLTGPSGASGPGGPIGPAGATGSAGANGATGSSGPIGPSGVAGPAGAAGPTGPQGPQGTQGLTGPTGTQGPIGSTGPQGPQGPQGAGFTWRGAFNCAASYSPRDVVSYQGSTWITNTATGGCLSPPTKPWELVAAEGLQGLTGPTGPIGINGSNGAPGPTGPLGPTGPAGPAGTVTHAAPPCFDNANRYVNCGNGTVTDTVTGLIWLKNGTGGCFGFWKNYPAANQAAAALADAQCGLTDGSSAGDWRLPTKAEWAATIARAVALGCTGASAPSLTNDPGTGCISAGPTSFSLPQYGNFWSSSVNESAPSSAWYASINDGSLASIARIHPAGFDNQLFMWPVRGGR